MFECPIACGLFARQTGYSALEALRLLCFQVELKDRVLLRDVLCWSAELKHSLAQHRIKSFVAKGEPGRSDGGRQKTTSLLAANPAHFEKIYEVRLKPQLQQE